MYVIKAVDSHFKMQEIYKSANDAWKAFDTSVLHCPSEEVTISAMSELCLLRLQQVSRRWLTYLLFWSPIFKNSSGHILGLQGNQIFTDRAIILAICNALLSSRALSKFELTSSMKWNLVWSEYLEGILYTPMDCIDEYPGFAQQP